MQNCRYIQGAVALFATLLVGTPLLAAEAGLVSGRVTSAEAPLPVSQVYAYQLGDLTLRKVTTDESGSFVFHDLPSGLYKIIAFKPGFLPGIALLSRASAQAVQFLEVELKSRDEAAADSKADFWSIRQQIPTDVLRHIDLAVITTAEATPSPRLDGLRASMRAVSGVDTIAMARTAQHTLRHPFRTTRLFHRGLFHGQPLSAQGVPMWNRSDRRSRRQTHVKPGNIELFLYSCV